MLFSGTQANVALSGTLTLTKNTLSSAVAKGNAAGDFTLGTVGAGKVWRIIGYSLSAIPPSAVTITADLVINGVTVATQQASGTAGAACVGVNNQCFSYADAIVAAAGKEVKLTQTNAGNTCCTIHYIEESA